MQFRHYVRKRTIWLEWQKALFPETKELLYTEVQLKRFTVSRINKDTETIDNCNLIFKYTTDPKIFFKHLNLYFECKKELIALEPYINNVSVKYPEVLYYGIGKQQLVTEFLHRYGNFITDNADKSKTPDEHNELWQGFYVSLKNFNQEMNIDNINYYMNLYNVNMAKYKIYSHVN